MFLIKAAKMYFQPAGLLRFAPYILIIPIVVFHALSLAGCVSTSPAIPNIYAVALRANNNATDTPLQVRIGYFGICGIDEEGTTCQTASGRSVEALAANLFPEILGNNKTSDSTRKTDKKETSDISDLVTTALDLQSRTFTPILAGAAVLFILGLAALFLFKRDVGKGASWEHPRRSAIVRRTTYGMLCGSAALSFAAAIATSQAAGALEYASESMGHASVLIKSGTTLQVLQWTAFGFQSLFLLAVPFLVKNKTQAPEGEFKGEA
ncbi:Ca2+ regulator and membrane fusion protein Fig1-domain-containing protein [Corynascus novoguineensis]|uniref:Ca2+ regulator and membrane fusion protein Fig1-domain-containing protein n=1 Tax=Corynascus novoguineensis TaxID=1126955 RepID=A0AAN7CSJ8_9PEZI|nr:Ca2+ regulator and membrane fusion protein Fig1-domain-containing protein [Corynascus novoguineensis]